MSPTDWMRENAQNYTDLLSMIRACSDATGSAEMTCRKLYGRLTMRGEVARLPSLKNPCREIACSPTKELPGEEIPQPVKIGITASELRARYDTRFIVSQQADKLQKGIFLSEAEFIQACSLRTLTGYRSVIDHSAFNKYKGRAGGVTYWSHPESISEMKEATVLQ